MSTDRRSSLLAPWFLYTLLLVSTATNAVLITRMKFPEQWSALQYALNPVPPVRASDRITGKSDSRITVIEYADFECPFCADMHKAMQELARNGDVKWVYRHYPLVGIHPGALAAAEASECAGDQGKFWEFAASLYQTENATTLDGVATHLGLDVARFKTCMQSGKHTAVVTQHLREGHKMKMTGTPTYFINGRRFEGFRSEADLRNAILAEL